MAKCEWWMGNKVIKNVNLSGEHSMKKLLLPLLISVSLISLNGCSQATTPTSTENTQSNNSQCRDNVLAGVYHPSRLVIKDKCKTVSGTVERVRGEKDGDYHINVKLDNEFADLINDKNKSGQHGDLVVEVIPIDAKQVPIPKAGQHVTVTGAYVLDKEHGWMEIHPAWFINGKGSLNYDNELAKKYEEGNPNKQEIEEGD